ncbi:MAG: FAD-dependent oxidoreductase [Ktedonobacteraceae bacterium]|nr:FAD-dependent oxidoreductase [Ktedonobacteraceae bacterium]
MSIENGEENERGSDRVFGEMKRREFLALGALGSLTGLLAACQSGSSADANATPVATQPPTPTQTPSPTHPPTLTNSDWTTLAHNLKGPLVRPGSSQYAVARRLFDPRFDGVSPMAVAYCISPADVQTCLAFARRFNLPLVPRCGGHSYAGYSTTTGIVVDVTRMNTVSVNASAGTATVGSGAKLIDVYSGLAQQGRTLPAGSCPTVGISGLTLGGGVGVLGRKFGLTCDSLLSAQVVVADGRVLTCDARSNADLFWALRGGGGGNFGVVTSFTFRTYAVGALSLFTLRWPWSSAATVVDAWQHWAPQAPDEIWSNCLLQATGDKNADPLIQVNGVYVGDVAPLNTLLAQLTNQIGVAPSSKYVWSDTVLNTMLYEAGCYKQTVGQCHLPTQDPNGGVQRVTAGAKSDYFAKLLSRQGVNNLVNAVASRHNSSVLADGGIGLDASGGAINRVPVEATAFTHRNDLFSAQYSASWTVGDASSVVSANHTWLTNTWQAMRPYASGAAYQNYIDPYLADWQHAYYGTNLARLQHVKATYDATNFFHFAQSIAPVL